MIFNLKSKFENRQSSKFRERIFKILAIGCVLILIFFFLGSSISSVFIKIFSPGLNAYNNFKNNFSLGFSVFRTEQSLVTENVNLKERVTQLEVENLNLKAQISEDKIITKREGFIETLPISFPPQMPYDTLLINKGSNDGIEAGSRVYIGDRIVVGSVESVYSNNSKVKLFTSYGLKTEAVLERTGEVLELNGLNSGNFKIELPLNFDIAEGDLLVLPDLPRTIVAKVFGLKKDEASSFVKVFLSTPIKINGNTILYVSN